MLELLTEKQTEQLYRWGEAKSIPRTSLETMDRTDLVVLLASNPSKLAYEIMERLMDKPIYMCARGETSVTLYDSKNRPIITPRGSYRGLPRLANSNDFLMFKRTFREYKAKIDNRIIIGVVPNPKKPGSIAHAHFAQYRVGKSVTWHFNNTEITRADFRFDEKKAFVTVQSGGNQ